MFVSRARTCHILTAASVEFACGKAVVSSLIGEVLYLDLHLPSSTYGSQVADSFAAFFSHHRDMLRLAPSKTSASMHIKLIVNKAKLMVRCVISLLHIGMLTEEHVRVLEHTVGRSIMAQLY